MKKKNEMLDEYDFSNGIRGKYTEQYDDGVNIIKLDKDVRKIFPDAQSVNNALRTLINLIPKNKTDDENAVHPRLQKASKKHLDDFNQNKNFYQKLAKTY